MKVKFTIEKGQETEKQGMFSSKQVDKYELVATFTPSEIEKRIFNDHPLFKDMVFIEYNEVDKFATGFLGLGKEQAVDNTKRITVSQIYGSPTFKFRAYSVPRVTELRGLILEAGERFADNVKVLSQLLGTDEIEFAPNA